MVAATREELAAARAQLPGRVGVAMTMGALHAGHASLFAAARADCDSVIATIFVNPLQFGANEDLSKYPRTFEADLEVCRAEGVHVVFAPTEAVMYPSGGAAVTVHPGPLGDVLEGASRPGHFTGVLTVVSKLLHLTRPDVAYFGEKDYQQLTLIRRMAADLDMNTEIVGAPIVREADGLALSSRNRYLSAAERELATALPAALKAGVSVAAAGGDAVLKAATAEFDRLIAAGAGRVSAPATAELDYLALTDPDLGPAPERGAARLLITARVGTTRLLDNTAITLG